MLVLFYILYQFNQGKLDAEQYCESCRHPVPLFLSAFSGSCFLWWRYSGMPYVKVNGFGFFVLCICSHGDFKEQDASNEAWSRQSPLIPGLLILFILLFGGKIHVMKLICTEVLGTNMLPPLGENFPVLCKTVIFASHGKLFRNECNRTWLSYIGIPSICIQNKTRREALGLVHSVLNDVGVP